MSLLPPTASFEERVQDFFLLFRNSGVTLSPLDQELLREWADMDVPFEVVARGIEKAAERALWDSKPGEVLRSLRACKRSVQGEIRKYRDRAVGRSQAPLNSEQQTATALSLEEERAVRCIKALRKFASTAPALESTIERLTRWIEAKRQEGTSEVSGTMETRVEMALLRALPFSERLAVLKEAREWVEQAGCTSAQARLRSRRFHRAAVLRRVLSLPSFW